LLHSFGVKICLPIVFPTANDPVGAGLVENLAGQIFDHAARLRSLEIVAQAHGALSEAA
jgi:hypothetical protein